MPMKWTIEYYYLGRLLNSAVMYNTDTQFVLDNFSKWMKTQKAAHPKGSVTVWCGTDNDPWMGIVSSYVVA